MQNLPEISVRPHARFLKRTTTHLPYSDQSFCLSTWPPKFQQYSVQRQEIKISPKSINWSGTISRNAAYSVSRTEATGCARRTSGRILILTPGRFDVRKHRVFPLSVRDGCNENRYRNIFEHRGKDVFLFTHWVIVFDNSHQYLVEIARRE